MAKRFHCTYKSTKNVTYNVEIWDTAFAGASTEFDIAEGGFSLRMAGEGNEILNHMSPTDCEFDYMIANATDFALITDLLTANEGRFTIKISKGTGTPTPYWYGQIVPDIGGYAEEYYPQRFKVRATDGLGLLKTIDFKDTGGAYTGKERALFVIKNAIKKLPYVTIHWGSGDDFISTMMDSWEETMDSGGTDPDALFQQYLDYSVWQTYDKGEEKYTSCYDVIKNILITNLCRITQRNGVFLIEQIYYRTETTVIVRTYTRDGGLDSAVNFGTLNDINQTAAGALLAIGQYEFFPALRRVEHTYDINIRRNFLESVPPMNESSSLINVYKPINKNGDKTTLRFTGNLAISLSSDISDPTFLSPFDPFCLIFRVNLQLDTYGLERLYDLIPSFQVVYEPMRWHTTPALYIAVPITNAAFLINTSDDIFTFSQQVDIMTPVLPESCDDFSISISLAGIEKYDGTTYSTSDFTTTFELTKPWLEAYSYGSPAITEDERMYPVDNDVNVNNSAILETKSLIGTSQDPNSLGAIWVKPASDYILANNWGTGVNTPDRPIEYLLIEIALSGQYAPTRRLQGTIYGTIEQNGRFLWDGVYWLLLGGTWDADNDELTGQWVELKYDQNFAASPPIRRIKFSTSAGLPTVQPASGQGGPVYEMVAKPPGTLLYTVALTTTDEALLAGAVTSIDISEVLTAGDVYDGDTLAIVNPLTGDFDELLVTATSTAGQTAIAVTGTLSVRYPANAPIIKKPKIGTFTLPLGTTGDLLYHNGTKWVVRAIGSTSQILTVVAGVPAWAANAAAYTDEQAQDAVGGILADSTTIDFIYNDIAPSITASVIDDSITYSKIQNVATNNRILGRVSGAGGNIEELTPAQVAALIAAITGTLTAGRVTLSTGTNTVGDDADLVFNGTSLGIGVVAASLAALLDIGTAAGASITAIRSMISASAALIWYLDNIGTGAAFLEIRALATGAADPFIRFSLTGTGALSWAAGIDNSDSDIFKISSSGNLGTAATDLITLTAGGLCAIGGGNPVGAINLYLYGQGGLRLPSGNTAARPSTAQNIIRNNTDFGGAEIQDIGGGWHLLSATASPTVTKGNAVGTGASSVTISGTYKCGTINITMGTSPTPNGIVCTVNFVNSFSAIPIMIIQGATLTTRNDELKFFVSNIGQTSATITAIGTLSAGPTTYSLWYIIQN